MNMIVMTIRGIMGGKHEWIYLTESKQRDNIEISDDDIRISNEVSAIFREKRGKLLN